MECIIHYEKVDEAAESVVLSASKLAELKYVAKEWVKTGKEPECFIAKNLLTMTMDECSTYKYHRLCMFRFSKSKLERAKESAMKRKVCIKHAHDSGCTLKVLIDDHSAVCMYGRPPSLVLLCLNQYKTLCDVALSQR